MEKEEGVIELLPLGGGVVILGCSKLCGGESGGNCRVARFRFGTKNNAPEELV